VAFTSILGARTTCSWKSLREVFGEIQETLVRAPENRENLSPELCAHPERGYPQAALAPELARADKGTKPQIVAELANCKSQMLPFIPGRRTVDQERTFFAIFSTMIGAVEMARILLDLAREKVLASTRDFLLRSFGHLNHGAQQRLWHVVLIPGKPL
jgi:TetR/AcrR family transcriptional repressor of nem operon